MAYSDFNLARALADFGLTVAMNQSLFAQITPVPISPGLAGYWAHTRPLGLSLRSERARSEYLNAPLLAEVWQRSRRAVAVLAGMDFPVDAAAGLTGVCDYILALTAQTVSVQAPVLAVVEAKRESIVDGLGQCAAEMVAAQRFNRDAGTPRDVMYGCVTTGALWNFLTLDGRAYAPSTRDGGGVCG